METYRDMMIENGDNLSWCVPYANQDGSIIFVQNEGEVIALMVNGHEVHPAENDRTFTAEQLQIILGEAFKEEASEEYENFVQNYGKSKYNKNHLPDLFHLVDTKYHQMGCAKCPWFYECDAMEDPDD